MQRITILYAREDSTLAIRLAEYLQRYGYLIQRKPQSHSLQLEALHQALKQQILDCDLVLALWSAQAAHSQTVSEQLRFAQTSKQPVYLVQIDSQEPPIPATLVFDPHGDLESMVKALIARFPAPPALQQQSNDIVEISCPSCQRLNIYKLAEICAKKRIIFRSNSGELANSRVLIYCLYCYKTFTAHNIDCSGYK